MDYQIDPADSDGFQAVMGERGGCGGCWCMLWRRSAAQMRADQGAGNRAAMKALFDTGHVPGLVARHDGQPVG